jgi:hypothetical protein
MLGFAACGSDEETTGGGETQALYEPSGSSKLLVNNTSATEDILLYKEAPSAVNKPFAGVRSGKQGHGVKNAPEGLYVLYAVTQANYDLDNNDPKVAMSLLVYVDQTPQTYDVGAGMLGTATIMIKNQSANFIEVHTETFTGPLFFTVRPWEFGVTKYVPDGNYNLFPVAKIEQKAGGKTVAVYSKVMMKGRKTFGLYTGEPTQFFDVTPGAEDVGTLRTVECLIYIQNNFDNGGGGSYIHQGGAGGPVIKNTLGREIANLGTTFGISWRPEINQTTGVPLSENFNAVFVLENVQGSSQVCTLAATIGNSYTITCKADGSWDPPQTMSLD